MKETPYQKELKAIEQQLQYALDELSNKNPDKQLLHDWISDPLWRVRSIINPTKEKTMQRISSTQLNYLCKLWSARVYARNFSGIILN